ncbi:MAG: radical SAM protein [Deltaproteobacteria bacterium]|nr:radical SAM protein [Deltaproteobacteria bacterium]
MGTKVDLLLVNPGNRLEQFAKLNELATVAQPLGIAMIAAFIRQFGYSVAIIDAEAEFWTPEQSIAEIQKYDPILLGLSAFTTKMTAAEKTLRLVKEKMPGVKTMIGGHHSSAIPEQTVKEGTADFVIQGEGYYPTLELLKGLKKGQKDDFNIKGVWYLKNGEVIKNARADSFKNIDELPFAAWDLLPMKKYRAHHWQTWDYNLDLSGFSLLHTSYGCPFQCDYCSVNVVYEKYTKRYRDPERVAQELSLLVNEYKVKHVEIIDDTFTVNFKRVEELCETLIRYGLGDKVNMWCFGRTDRVDAHLMSLMKRAGINWVFMGFESGSDEILASVHKKQTIAQIKKAADTVRKAGLCVGGNYVFGLPQDTPESMQATLNLAKEMNTEYANFFVMMAYPGTGYYEMAKQKNYPLPEKWGQYGFFAPDALPLRNERLTAEDILKFRDGAFQEYFGGASYQGMIEKRFGTNTLNFIRDKILSKKISRTRYSI